MINEYSIGDSPLVINCDLAAEFPLYLYLAEDKRSLLYSISIVELLNDSRVKKPIVISASSVSFLLQSGVVPPPKTVYENIFIVGVGDSVVIRTLGDQVELEFKHEFPFFNSNRLICSEMQPNEDIILQMLAEATTSRIDLSKPSFLFHSAGKDSNSIALALAEAGWQDKVTLITHKTKGLADESELSKLISKKLGFKHQILYEVDKLENSHKQAVGDYFINAPFPCTDNVTLAYPLYSLQMPELMGANIIDGGGNDCYMATPPTKREIKALPLSKLASNFSFLRKKVRSENLISQLLRTPAEWYGMFGLSHGDSSAIFSDNISVYDHWKLESELRNDWDIFDFKTDILTSVVASELHIRKVRIFSDVIGSNLILPFSNKLIAEYFSHLPEKYLFDRKTLKNKLVLRKILKDRIGLDSDAVGKMGFNYDTISLVMKNWDWITQEIYKCTFWNTSTLVMLLKRFESIMKSNHRYAELSGRLIYRIYLLSAWINNNRYTNV